MSCLPFVRRFSGDHAGKNSSRSVAGLLAAHPGLTLLADDRELLAALIYYVRPHPFSAVEWNPVPGITDQFDCPSMMRLMAGRPLLILNGDQDPNCPIEGARCASDPPPLQAVGPGREARCHFPLGTCS